MIQKLRDLPHHEYWPAWLFYGPIYADYLRNTLRLRSIGYPLLVNPMMEHSGFIGEDKAAILAALPEGASPPHYWIDPNIRLEKQFPGLRKKAWVAKPNQGERGFGVRRVSTKAELIEYHERAPRAYLLQEYVDWPLEYGLFFVRRPENPKGEVTSLCSKEPITLSGDGRLTVEELCFKDERFEKQIPRLRELYPETPWNKVLAKRETIDLDVIRNHRRGSRFLDARHLITPALTQAIQNIFPEGCGFNYGRIDLRAKSAKSFQQGRDFLILEVNGVTSEPGEIYDPSMSLVEAYSILRTHWDAVAEIGAARLRETRAPNLLEIYGMFKEAISRPSFLDR